MAAEVDALVGPTGQHNAGRTAVRHGVEQGYVYLGDRKVPVMQVFRNRAVGSHAVPGTHIPRVGQFSSVMRIRRSRRLPPAW